MNTNRNIHPPVTAILNSRNYRFQEQGRSTHATWLPYTNRSNIQERQQNTASQNYISPDEIRLNHLVNPEELLATFNKMKKEGGQGAGIDGLTYADYSYPELFNMFRNLSTQILRRTYLPAPTRPVRHKKPGGGWRELELQCIPDRLIATKVLHSLSPFFRQILPNPSPSVETLYAKLEQDIENQNQFIIATDDIENCFPTTPISPVIECHRQIINNTDLLWLIETVIRGHEGQNRTIGLCQGSPYSPIALELLLYNHLETPFSNEYQGSRNLHRYVDNLIVVCNNELDSRQALQFTEDSLKELGFQLKHNEGPPMDIRDNTDRTILGLIPRWQNRKLKFSIPEEAFGKLETTLNETTLERYPLKNAGTVTKSWLFAYGPATDDQAVQDVVDRVIGICQRSGFMELSHNTLYPVALEAHQKWLTLRSKVRSTNGNH